LLIDDRSISLERLGVRHGLFCGRKQSLGGCVGAPSGFNPCIVDLLICISDVRNGLWFGETKYGGFVGNSDLDRTPAAFATLAGSGCNDFRRHRPIECDE
jgi:hypothetical protein